MPITDYAHFVELLSRVGCHVYSGEIATDGTYVETYTGPGVERFLGYVPPPGADRSEAWNQAVHADDAEQYRAAGLGALGSSTAAEYRLVASDGTVRWVLDQMWVRSAAPNGNLRVDGVVTDITARKHAELELFRIAQHDSLTNLANRMQFEEHLETRLAALPARPSGQDGHDHAERGVALLVLDLDGFKEVNDRYGHIAGDELLLAVARRVTACLRSVDLAARLGGDEFAILLEGVDQSDASLVAQRILESTARPYSVADEVVVVTSSIGIAHVTYQVPPDEIVRDADAAMYDAKAAGRNRAVAFHHGIAARRTGWPTTRR
jgi:diguanylate cyclase (GGDEF)-like protein